MNHPSAILSWIETCTTRVEDERVCETEVLQQGLDYTINNDEIFTVRFIFENDSAEDLIFQLEYLDQIQLVKILESFALFPFKVDLLSILAASVFLQGFI